MAGGLIALTALAVSPLGYLAIPYLETATNEAAASIAEPAPAVPQAPAIMASGH